MMVGERVIQVEICPLDDHRYRQQTKSISIDDQIPNGWRVDRYCVIEKKVLDTRYGPRPVLVVLYWSYERVAVEDYIAACRDALHATLH